MNFKAIPYKKMSYRELISYCLRTHLAETDLTQAELARRLGFDGSGNIISMHLDVNNRVSAFPVSRLPALKRECQLDWYACAVLLDKRAVCHGAGSTKLDQMSTHFILHCGAKAVADRKNLGYGEEVGHGC
jgi:hypothetical protein